MFTEINKNSIRIKHDYKLTSSSIDVCINKIILSYVLVILLPQFIFYTIYKLIVV